MPSRLRRLADSTALRLAVGLVAIFALTMALLFGAALLSVRESLRATIEDELDQRLTEFEAARNAPGLAALVAAETARLDPEGTGGRDAVTGEGTLIQQALANHLENALRHTPPGTPIELGVGRRGDRVTAWVADRGPGIPREERVAVPRRLYRLERSRSTPGHGLGLSLVIVASLHEADLALTDEHPGRRVTLAFPSSDE